MPFTANEFLDVFAAYNRAVWPFAVMLWLLTTVVCGSVLLGASKSGAPLRFLLAAHWLWAGLVYHAWFFTAINPAAWMFAALFVAEGVMFIAFAPPHSQAVDVPSAPRGISSLLIVYSLIYPVVVWADGFVYPRMPTFGVPCPTVLLTIGVLLATPRPSVLLSVIPVAWSVIAGTAAWLFGVHADFVLPAAGGLLVVHLILIRSHVMKKLSFTSVFVVLVAMLVFLPSSPALAQADQHDHQQQAQKGGMKMMDGKMMEDMAAKKKANTERITALMATVKSATGEAKVAAMADVIAVLVEERAAMTEHCAAMMKMMGKEVDH